MNLHADILNPKGVRFMQPRSYRSSTVFVVLSIPYQDTEGACPI